MADLRNPNIGFADKTQSSYDLSMKKLPLTISGMVIEGKKYGRKIGFPTANLDVKQYDISNGIYAGFAKLENLPEKYKVAIIIDPTPSFEVHILDFNKNIYGQKLEIEIVEKIRPFQKFETEEELISQIKKDLEKVKELLIL